MNIYTKRVLSGLFVVSVLAICHTTANGSCSDPETSLTGGVQQKTFSDYKGVKIGTSTEDVRSKLGGPKDKSDAMDLYVFSDDETAQFYYDESHAVKAIMINYSGDLKGAPTPKDVFGEDVPAREDGGLFKMVRYPKLGYWVSYNRSGGDDAVISIAMQKI
ncbi:MAG: hypothetical protein WBO10_16240 [Pyrinomonadaceae bacterium]